MIVYDSIYTSALALTYDSFSTSLIEGLALGSFCSSHRMRLEISGEVEEAGGGLTTASMIFRIKAH
jgi:hypothetical protein